MDDAQWHLRFGVGRANGVRKSGQSMDAHRKDVSQATVLEIGQTRQPKLAPSVVAEPQAEQLLVPFPVLAQRHEGRGLSDASIRTPNKDDQAIGANDGPKRVELPRSRPGKCWIGVLSVHAHSAAASRYIIPHVISRVGPSDVVAVRARSQK